MTTFLSEHRVLDRYSIKTIPGSGFRHLGFPSFFHVFCTNPRRLIALPLYTYNTRNFHPSATQPYLYFVSVVFTEKAPGLLRT